jgi:hypothetical protein
MEGTPMTAMRFRVENHLLVANRPPLTGEQPHQVRLLPQAATQDPIIPWLIINHTQAASRPISLESAWLTDTKRTDGIESHLLCDMDGRLLQSMPFNIVAHTSYKANRFYVSGVGWCGQLSVESQDQGAATLNQTPWSPAQFEVLCQAWAACCVAYGIPVQPVPSAYGRGVSQHNAFADWSKSAHSCPGTARTAQMPAMRARIQQIIDDASPVVVPPTSEEDDMRTIITRWAGEPYDIEVGDVLPASTQRPWRGINPDEANALIAAGLADDRRGTPLPLSLKGAENAGRPQYPRIG